ncbi:MAG: HlyD family secretion protein, partial [Alphaproteobacteria bacterium]
DSYPNYQWRGVVESISPATGAEFALIPAQNASGNWVKVVQRVPVRVRIESPEDVPPLRAGMSATVKIDTGYSRSLGSLWHDMIAWF